MKKRLPLFVIFFILFNLSLGIFIVSDEANAVIGRCTCQKTGYLEPTYSPRNCSECDSYCPLSTILLGSENFNLERSSCTEDGTGGVTCGCAITVTRVPEEACRGAGDISCEFTAAGGVGTTCLTDDDCHGTGCEYGCYCYNGNEDARVAGFTDLDAYWRDLGVSSASCYAKIGNGENCIRPGQCGSNYCGRPEGGDAFSPDVCRPQPGPGEEETPPPTEGDVFPTYEIKSPIGEVTGPELIGRIIKTVLGIVGALALAMFVYGGFTWLTSGGSPDKIKKGRDILMWAVIGLIVIFTSYTLVDFVLTAFGL